jgi:hypothetical protein
MLGVSKKLVDEKVVRALQTRSRSQECAHVPNPISFERVEPPFNMPHRFVSRNVHVFLRTRVCS